MSVNASSTTETIHIAGGERIYPCRCGQIHRGTYGATDWNHHNCFHEQPLISMHALDPEMDEKHYICPTCGKDFWIGTP